MLWIGENPFIGGTITMKKVQAACEFVKQNPAEENFFRQLRLSQRVKHAVRWMPMDNLLTFFCYTYAHKYMLIS